MYTIGYVDEDEGEVKKVARRLRDNFKVKSYDVSAGPGKDELIDDIYNSDIDLLLVDFMMKDKGVVTYNGDEIAREYEKIRPEFPIIIFTNRETDAFPVVDDVNAIYDKENLTREKKSHFIEILYKNILRYEGYVSQMKGKLENLIEKRVEQELSPSEKEELFTLQLELGRLDKRSFAETPNHMLSDQNLDQLTALAKDADELLQEFLNKYGDASV